MLLYVTVELSVIVVVVVVVVSFVVVVVGSCANYIRIIS